MNGEDEFLKEQEQQQSQQGHASSSYDNAYSNAYENAYSSAYDDLEIEIEIEEEEPYEPIYQGAYNEEIYDQLFSMYFDTENVEINPKETDALVPDEWIKVYEIESTVLNVEKFQAATTDKSTMLHKMTHRPSYIPDYEAHKFEYFYELNDVAAGTDLNILSFTDHWVLAEFTNENGRKQKGWLNKNDVTFVGGQFQDFHTYTNEAIANRLFEAFRDYAFWAGTDEALAYDMLDQLSFSGYQPSVDILLNGGQTIMPGPVGANDSHTSGYASRYEAVDALYRKTYGHKRSSRTILHELLSELSGMDLRRAFQHLNFDASDLLRHLIDGDNWHVDSVAYGILDRDLKKISFDYRTKALKIVANGFRVGEDEDTVLRILRLSLNEEEAPAMQIFLEEEELLERLEAVMHGADYNAYHRTLSLLHFNAQGLEQTIAQMGAFEEKMEGVDTEKGKISIKDVFKLAKNNVFFYYDPRFYEKFIPFGFDVKYEGTELINNKKVEFDYAIGTASLDLGEDPLMSRKKFSLDAWQTVRVYFWSESDAMNITSLKDVPFMDMPAINLLALANEEFHQNVRAITDAAMIIGAALTFWFPTSTFFLVAAVIDLVVGALDIVIQSFKQELNDTPWGKAILSGWDQIQMLAAVFGVAAIAAHAPEIITGFVKVVQNSKSAVMTKIPELWNYAVRLSETQRATTAAARVEKALAKLKNVDQSWKEGVDVVAATNLEERYTQAAKLMETDPNAAAAKFKVLEGEVGKLKGRFNVDDIEPTGDFSPAGSENRWKKEDGSFASETSTQSVDIKPGKLPAGHETSLPTSSLRTMQETVSNHTGDHWLLFNSWLKKNGKSVPTEKIQVWFNMAEDAKGFTTVDHRRLVSARLAGEKEIEVVFISADKLMEEGEHLFKMTTKTKGESIDLLVYLDPETGKFVNPHKLRPGQESRPFRWKLKEQPDGTYSILADDGKIVNIDDIRQYVPDEYIAKHYPDGI